MNHRLILKHIGCALTIFMYAEIAASSDWTIVERKIEILQLRSQKGVGTGEFLKPGAKFKILKLNRHNSRVQLSDGRIVFLKRNTIEPWLDDSSTEGGTEGKCRNCRIAPSTALEDVVESTVRAPKDLAYTCGRGKTSDPLTCMACNNYNEAGHEGYESMKAVAKVVLGRKADPDNLWPKDICKIIYQRDSRGYGQFAWSGKKYKVNGRLVGGVQPKPRTKADKNRWQIAIKAAADALKEGPKMKGRIFQYFYGDYIKAPRFARSSNCVTSRVVPGSRHYFVSCDGPAKGDRRKPTMLSSTKSRSALLAVVVRRRKFEEFAV